jgi:hypothetical protein
MSSPLAIAAVTAVLKNFLENSITEVATALGGTVTVSAEPPDRIDIATASPDRINLFLFQATENAGWRNYGLPMRNGNGDRISNPPLALDLSYLLTAYGSGPLHAEALLGYAMFVLHEMPVLTQDAIRAITLATPDPPLLAGLKASELADQIEQIKIAPQTMSVEELSKIWSALLTQYRPTAVYKASVVLIESEKSVRPTLPVRARNILVLPFERPSIDRLQSQAADGDPIVADQPILAGYNLVIDGGQLRGTTTVVVVDDTEIVPNDDQITAARIIVPLPADLQPGLHSVQVVQPVDFGTGLSSDPHRGVASNVAAFVLAPQIATAAPIAAARETTLTLAIKPPVGRGQRVALLAGRNTISISARSATGPPTTASLDFPIPEDFPTGTQLLRVQIDGAESPLEVDTTGQFASPTVEIT